MSSEAQVYVWIYLPGTTEPVVAGRFSHVRTAGGGVGSFVYGKSYLGRPNAVPLDPVALPLHKKPFSTTHLSGWFSALLDAGPDDWGKRLIDRLHGPQETLGYLLLARGQSVGALAFSTDPSVPPLNHGHVPGIDSLERLFDLHRAIEAGESVADEDRDLLLQGTSAGGARPKTTIAHDAALWLAKFTSTSDNRDQPPVPTMEGALLTVAEACGIRVPRHRVVNVGDATVLLVERFDRERLADGRFARRRYVSARTVLWSRPEVQGYSYMGSYTNLARQMRVWERTPSEDIRELFRRIAFNCLVGNTDDHDCNTGFLADVHGFFSLSPAFDLTARPATPRMFLAMGFGENGGEVSWSNLLSEPEMFGYERDEAVDMVRSQWTIVQETVVDRMVVNGCNERLAVGALRAMPGNKLIGDMPQRSS
ncbi:type II toxin-antitoxin system HipA family toxin [Piscinibacter sp.]|uniref:type II toxin-antitoxin system HipA family toxin n=1 Tax=Piscinibacter sp. TaxID=1903157 RepID=UPI002C90727A|nr:type II toxin-antitoxin system HipA family toxin [Albitalea sp.]HUG26421.1 type II toxin-antitoxin system HipA family toxin [Albitalea sp.]